MQDAQPRLDDSGLRGQGIRHASEILGGAIPRYLMLVGGILCQLVIASEIGTWTNHCEQFSRGTAKNMSPAFHS